MKGEKMTIEKIKLPDKLELTISDASAVHRDDFTSVEEVEGKYTMAVLKNKINEILAILKSASAVVAFFIAFAAQAELTVQKAQLDALENDAQVVTNVYGTATDPMTVTNIVEAYGFATTQEVAVIDAETIGVRKSSWNRPGDWTVYAQPMKDPVESTIISIGTSAWGVVLSNTVDTVSYRLEAKLVPTTLDEVGMFPTPKPTYDPVSSNLTISGDIARASKGGMYTATATANGETKTFKIPIMNRAGVSVSNCYYATDIAAAGSFVKQTNDEWLQNMGSLTSDGVVHSYSNHLWVGNYKVWTGVTIPCTAGRSGYSSRHAISPHVLASCAHYGGAIYSIPSISTFYDQNGVAKTMTTGVNGKNVDAFNLAEWAVANGWSEAEISAMGGRLEDIVLFVVDGGKYDVVPDNCCPYFMSNETRARRYGTYDGAHVNPTNTVPYVGGWATSQLYGRNGYPCLIRAAVASGTENMQCTLLRPANTFDSAFGWFLSLDEVDTRFYKAPLCRKDMYEYMSLRGSQSGYWMFPAIFSGDSGNGMYMKHQGRWVLMGQYYSAGEGPNFSTALPILRKFCAQYGDTLKEIE